MKKLRIETEVEVFSKAEDLPVAERALLVTAQNALQNSYAPYSRFRVAAVVLLANGETVTGNNMENASYPMCICAEQVALGTASARFPGVPVTAMAITVQSATTRVDQPAAPCGACRQVISETEDRHQQPIRIILRGETGEIFRLRSGKDLLPLSFNSSYL